MASTSVRDSVRPAFPDLSRFPRYPLTFGPSPVHPLPRLTRHLGGAEVWAKREDCNSGLAFGGNKIRKLEYLVADAIAQGADTLDFSLLPHAVPVNVDLTNDASLAVHALRTVQTGSPGQAAHFEHVQGGAGDDTLGGNAAANRLEGRGGNDALSGLAGIDLLEGGSGHDQLDGGADDDTYSFLAAAAAEVDTIAEDSIDRAKGMRIVPDPRRRTGGR